MSVWNSVQILHESEILKQANTFFKLIFMHYKICLQYFLKFDNYIIGVNVDDAKIHYCIVIQLNLCTRTCTCICWQKGSKVSLNSVVKEVKNNVWEMRGNMT